MKKRNVFGCISIVILSAASVTMSPHQVLSEEISPEDESIEQSIQNSFNAYQLKRIPHAQFSELSAQQQAKDYSVQNRDTLWDLSRTFFGDSFFWPHLWAANGAITNPHEIKNGQVLRFIPGSEEQAPQLVVADPSKEKLILTVPPELSQPQDLPDEDYSSTADMPLEQVEIPPPLKVYKKPLKTLPPSIPQWQTPGAQGAGEEYVHGISVKKQDMSHRTDKKPLLTYAVNSVPSGVGVVRELEAGNHLGSSGAFYYLELSDGAKIGDIFTAYEKDESVKTLQFFGRNREVVRNLGELEIVGVIDADDGLYRALAVRSFHSMAPGSQLRRGRVPNVELVFKGQRASEQLESKIIGGSADLGYMSFGLHSMVYLQDGSDVGIKIGQLVPIFADRTKRVATTIVQGSYQPIGIVKIVDVQDDVSTGVIVDVWEPIFPGDFAGGPWLEVDRYFKQKEKRLSKKPAKLFDESVNN